MERSNSYPLQNAEFSPSQTIPHSELDDTRPRLPRNLRALRDDGDALNHPRTLVICLDGTGDQFDSDNSNVVHFVSCLKKHSPNEQVTYYQSGIGTYDKGGLKNGFAAGLDMAVGSGLGVHIKEAYEFLMQNYQEGDKICLFGFSRGAYTVRCLAGFLHKCGLLPASNSSQVNFAYNFYKDDTEEGWKMSAEFKKTFCTDVNVYFLGLWDCVASVGFIPRKLPFSKSPTNHVQHFRHAMALDEHRAKFKVCQWQHKDPSGGQEPKALQRRPTIDNTPGAKFRRSKFNCFPSKAKNINPQAILAEHKAQNGHVSDNALELKLNGIATRLNSEKRQHKEDDLEAKFEAQDETRRKQKYEPDAVEVWFMGAHADIGGGAVKNEERHKLSNVPLRWMLRQCFECNTGILFDTIQLARQGLDVDTLWPVYKERTRPVVGPPPALMEKYEMGTLKPLKQRSTFLNLADDIIDDAPTAEDLQYVLPDESTEDYFDAMARVNDQLVDAKGWWILEVWPIKVRVVAKGGEGWEKKVSVNLGRYRAAREAEPKLHWTVRHMMDEGKYRLRARTDKTTNWIEYV